MSYSEWTVQYVLLRINYSKWTVQNWPFRKKLFKMKYSEWTIQKELFRMNYSERIILNELLWIYYSEWTIQNWLFRMNFFIKRNLRINLFLQNYYKWCNVLHKYCKLIKTCIKIFMNKRKQTHVKLFKQDNDYKHKVQYSVCNL